MPERPATPELLLGLDPLSTLGAARRAELAPLCRLRAVAAGIPILREGDRDHQTLYLLHGIVSVHKAGMGRLRELRAGTTARPLADRQPRPVTVVTETDCEVLHVDNDVLDAALTWNELAGGAANSGWMSELRQALVFRQLPSAHLIELDARMQRVPVAANETVIREGDKGDYYYIVETGCAVVHRRDDDGRTRVVAELGPGSGFGEEALVSSARRNATVTMAGAGVLKRLAKSDFDTLLRTPLLRERSYADAREQVADGCARWLDVRHEIEYRHVHVPGAISCPLHRLRAEADALDPGLEYVCYCRSGRRSSAAAFLLAQRGIRASVLRNGFEALPAYEAD